MSTDPNQEALDRIRLYLKIVQARGHQVLGDEIIFDSRFKTDSWPRRAYSLSCTDMVTLLICFDEMAEELRRNNATIQELLETLRTVRKTQPPAVPLRPEDFRPWSVSKEYPRILLTEGQYWKVAEGLGVTDLGPDFALDTIPRTDPPCYYCGHSKGEHQGPEGLGGAQCKTCPGDEERSWRHPYVAMIPLTEPTECSCGCTWTEFMPETHGATHCEETHVV